MKKHFAYFYVFIYFNITLEEHALITILTFATCPMQLKIVLQN